MIKARAIPLLLVAAAGLFLLFAFVLPNALLFSASFLKSEAQVITNEVTLDNFRALAGRPVYVQAIIRTFAIGASVGVLVALISERARSTTCCGSWVGLSSRSGSRHRAPSCSALLIPSYTTA